MTDPLRLLIVEDSEDDALLLLRELRRGGYEVIHTRVDDPHALAAALDDSPPDLVIADYSLPGFDALAALRLIQEREIDCPFIVVSGTIGEEVAVEAMKAGAHDYLMKDNLARLVPAVRRELREAAGRRERAGLEAQLRHAQKLEAVGRLAGGVAHDFNNLLTAIVGYSDVVMRRLAPDDPVRREVGQIQKAAQRATTLTYQLLAFSRKQVMRPRVLDLNSVVIDIERMLRRLIGDDIALATRLDPDAGCVRADPGQLEQVILNLAVNARDAMPAGGRLQLRTRRIRIDGGEPERGPTLVPGSYALLAISDTGIGMDSETLSRIFEPFFTTKEMGKGTGLGLSTVYGIVKQSNGEIAVDSEPSRGTTFSIYLPRIEALPERPTPASSPGELPRGSETILLVEDDPSVRGLMQEVLRMNGYRVLEAPDGQNAIRLCEEHPGPIHLLITDVVMHGLSGRELAQQAVRDRREMGVLYISGYSDDEIATHGLPEATGAFLEKPFSPETLAATVRDLLDARA